MKEPIPQQEIDSKEEMLDVVDEEGRVIGVASRAECHSNPELLHRVVHFTLFDLEKRSILLSSRASTKLYDPGKISFFGGHVSSGETPNSTVIREVIEELGYVPRGGLSDIGNNIFEYDKQRELATFYLVTYNGSELIPNDEEIGDIFWVPLGEVKGIDDNVGDITKYWIDRIDWEKLYS